ncbi:hypothetical protein [Spirosoma rhododendri]|uniref:hypothetical protein n=1 Tax=Spirosoma rhododendri TaxID=2728024 RepID=UPI0020C4B70C|nr:hypothetical protein [Spirosoma rhododendri]
MLRLRLAGWLVPLLLTGACSPQLIRTAQLRPTQLTAVNLEETVSQRDEIMLAYSLATFDAQNKPAGVVNGGWGVEPVRKGQVVELQSGEKQALPIEISVPRGGRVVASLVLVEVDAYDRAQQLVDQVKRVHNVVAGPASWLLTATEVLTPLRYVSAGLAASGVGLKLVDHLDDDDLLGQSSVEMTETELRQNKQGYVRVPVIFAGRNLRDAYEYRLTYDIRLGHVRPGKGKKESIRQ